MQYNEGDFPVPEMSELTKTEYISFSNSSPSKRIHQSKSIQIQKGLFQQESHEYY